MKRFLIAIEGHGFQDVEEIELPAPPAKGEPIETKYGTGIVSSTEEMSESPQFDAKIPAAWRRAPARRRRLAFPP